MSRNDDGHQLREALETNLMKVERECVKPHEPDVFPPWAHYRNDLRQMIREGDFDFTGIFEEVTTYEGGTYTDISNEGADALADYFIGLFEVIDENRGEAFTTSAVNAKTMKNEREGRAREMLRSKGFKGVESEFWMTAISDVMTDFVLEQTAALRQQLEEARDERDAYKDACEGYEMIIAEGREDEFTESVKQTTNKLISRLAQSNIALNVIAERAKEFVFYPENWEGYEDLKTSNSAAIPPEFMALCEAVEDRYGTPKDAALTAADDVKEEG